MSLFCIILFSFPRISFHRLAVTCIVELRYLQPDFVTVLDNARLVVYPVENYFEKDINYLFTRFNRFLTVTPLDPLFPQRIDFLKTLHVISLKCPAPNSIIKTLCSRLHFLFRG